MDCHNWILNVLADIREYAGMNDLPKLQGMAEDARIVAQSEIDEVRSDHNKAVMKMVLAVEPLSVWSQGASSEDCANFVPQGTLPRHRQALR